MVGSVLIAAYWPRSDSAASSLFGGMPGGYGLGAHHLPSAYAILGRGGSAPGFGGHTPASAPPPPPYSHSSLGTLSVAASQAASLGNNNLSLIVSYRLLPNIVSFLSIAGSLNNNVIDPFEFPIFFFQVSIQRVQHGGRWPHT